MTDALPSPPAPPPTAFTTSAATATPAATESVRVVIQSRPLLPFEIAHNAEETVQISETPPEIHVHRRNLTAATFTTFDAVYAAQPGATPNVLHNTHVSPLVSSLFTGVNATIFAYGQTSAGKSYTMRHVTAKVVAEIFAHKRRIETGGAEHVAVRVGFVEIYRETIRDLVDGAAAPLATVQVNVRERVTNAGRTTFLDGAKDRVVDNEHDLLDIIREGALVRRTAATGMNASSSRSHSIITISIIREQLDSSISIMSAKPPSKVLAAKLHLVDLAGSERAKRTAAGGTRFAEGVDINKGLFALAKVISTLADNSKNPTKRQAHVPYRDSKLTRLLQDSLGGNARTLLIACVSPADSSREETLGTLRYAERAKKIHNKPKVNNEANAVEVSDLRAALSRAKAEITALVADNERLKSALKFAPASNLISTSPHIKSKVTYHCASAMEPLPRPVLQGASDITDASPKKNYEKTPPKPTKQNAVHWPKRTARASPPAPQRAALAVRQQLAADEAPRVRNGTMRTLKRPSPVRRRLHIPAGAKHAAKQATIGRLNNRIFSKKTAERTAREPMRAVATKSTYDDNNAEVPHTRNGFQRRSKSTSNMKLCEQGGAVGNSKGGMRHYATGVVKKHLHAEPKRANGVTKGETRNSAFDSGSDSDDGDNYDENDDGEGDQNPSDDMDDGEEEETLASCVASALEESRVQQMRRTFTERLEQSESDKASIDSERLKLLRQLTILEQKHAREIEDIKVSAQSRLTSMRSKVAEVKKLEAETTRFSKQKDSMQSTNKKLVARVEAAERLREESQTRLAETVAKEDLQKRNLSKQIRSLSKSERSLRQDLLKETAGKTRLESMVLRLRSENEVIRSRLKEIKSDGSNVRRLNSGYTPTANTESKTRAF